VPSPSAAVTDAMPSSISWRAVERQPVHAGRMVLGVGGDGVAGIAHLAHAFGIGVGLASDQEEGRLGAMGGEDVEDLVAVFRQRTVVEGQHHLVIFERQRLGILHGADDADGRADRPPACATCRARRDGRAIGGRRGLRGDAGQHPTHKAPTKRSSRAGRTQIR
jgi:hypothetical protein